MKCAFLIGAAIAAAVAPNPAIAQCQSWSHGFGVKDGVEGVVRAAVTYDDGHGPALYLGGTILSAGDVEARSLVKWDGTHWSTVGAGLASTTVVNVNALAVFDDGTGSALYVAGFFTAAGGVPASNIARWNGTSWSALGTGLDASASSLCVYDDGAGPALYAGGFFTHAGGVNAKSLARWNGTSWSPLAPGSAGEVNSGVYTMTVFDDGNGPALYVGGIFSIAGNLGANRIARWHGNHFSTVGAAATNGIVGSGVNALCTFDDGHGNALYVTGAFTSAGGIAANRIAKWDASGWSSLGSGLENGLINTGVALTTFDDGSGNALYVGGNFASAGGVAASNVAKWNGSSWSALAGGIGDLYVFALAGFDDGSGPALFAAGSFQSAGGVSASRVARWKSSSWSALSIDGPGGMNGPVYALATFDDGGGTALYAGGGFTHAGTIGANHIVRWRNGAWTPLGNGLDGDVYALCVFNDGSGPALHAAGAFTTSAGAPVMRIAKWNGSYWTALGTGLDGVARALLVFNDGTGSALYAGGDFKNAGGAPAGGIARWRSATWSDVGGGVDAPGSNASVKALAVFNGIGGPALFAGGSFSLAGGVVSSNIASWTPAFGWIGGTGTDGPVSSFVVADFFGNPALYAGGNFFSLGAQQARGVAAWTGGGWFPVGAGLDGNVTALSVFDEGNGPNVFAGGTFVDDFVNTQGNHVSRWNGVLWSPLGDGIDGTVAALAPFQDAAHGAGLYAGGTFRIAGELASSFVAEWRGCANAIDTFCSGDGSIQNCPCGLDGLAGRGCQNSAFTGGAKLEATGSTQPDTIVLHSSSELPHAASIFLQGDAIQAPVSFGDGWLCTSGNALALFVKPAINGTATAPAIGNPSISARSAALGDPLLPGAIRYYQTYYRDPALAFCAAPQGDAWNVSSGVKLTW